MEVESSYPLSERERYCLYESFGFLPEAVESVEAMLRAAGARTVGKGAICNVVTAFVSRKMGGKMYLESHTCEQLYAYELEMDPAVLMYATQIPCQGVVRIKANGKRHVSTANADFLVIRAESVELIECKTASWLRKHHIDGGDWCLEDGRWVHGPLRTWAENAGVRFLVYVSPDDMGVYHRNLSAAYAALCGPSSSAVDAICAAACEIIGSHPRSVREVADLVAGFGTIHALLMLARRQVFGPWRSTPIDHEDRFVLFPDQVQADLLDEKRMNQRTSAMSSLTDTDDPLLRASAVDIEFARKRLQRVEAIRNGNALRSRRMNSLARKVAKAKETNGSELEICLTNYARSGNRTRRITEKHIALIQRLIDDVWNKGKVVRPIDLEMIYRLECQSAGISEDGISTLRIERRKVNPLRHALATGGMRGYQAVRSHSDPRRRSLPALAFGQLANIDSTSVDMRVVQWRDGERKPVTLRAIFYVAVDNATGMPLGMALLFGSPRSDGLAMLFRDIVRRNGFLPTMVHLDRGSENRSEWMADFCESTSVRYSPTAGSVWNSLAESALKMVNFQVSRRLIGSTAPDQRGRAADGRFKSRRTARLGFLTLHREIEHFIFDDLARGCIGADGSPFERKASLVEKGGFVGIPTKLDDDLLIRTSVKVRKTPLISRRGALRLQEGSYCSDELLEAQRRMLRIDHVRLDCEDGKLIYVKTCSGDWIKAFHQKFQTLIDEDSRVERTFDFCWDSIERPVVRKEKYGRALALNQRLNAANSCAPEALPDARLSGNSPAEPVRDSRKQGEVAPVRTEVVPFEEADL